MVTHPVVLRGPKTFEAGAGPLLLERTEPRFVDAVRAELDEPRRHARLKATVVQPATDARRRRARLKLYQPVHRTFHVALVEAFCDVPGRPPLDPGRIESAGMVVRRRVEGAELRIGRRSRRSRHAGLGAVHQAWMSNEDGVLGWVSLAPRPGQGAPVGMDEDPDATRRMGISTGIEELDRQLEERRSLALRPASEVVTPLFTLPEKTRLATRSSLLFGVVPTATADVELQNDPPETVSVEDVIAGFSPFLRENESVELPCANGTLVRPTGVPLSDPTEEARLKEYSAFVRLCATQLGLLGAGAVVASLLEELNHHELEFEDRERRVGGGQCVRISRKGLGDHLLEAARLLALPPTAESALQRIRMPRAWVRLSRSDVESLAEKAQAVYEERLGTMRPTSGQFAEPGSRFYVRTFVRVRREDGCPPTLVWSEPSETFEIAAWHENGPGPTPVVELPDPFGEGGIERFKPNVAFSVPGSIVDILRNNDPLKLAAGEGQDSRGLGIGWLCGFNIPLITLCAFIVLSIFLGLFNIIFWWLAFIRICIPFPVRKQ